jgi:peptidoglycan-N-acetylglucosamine deacetylase
MKFKKPLLALALAISFFPLRQFFSSLSYPGVLGVSTTQAETDQKVVALTFDDGPSPQYTDQILNILADHHIKATFFVVGEQVDKHPQVFIRTYRQGHEIGNHSNTHPKMGLMDFTAIAKEILVAENKINDLIHIRPNIFRVPYDWYNDQLPKVVRLLNMNLIGWNVDSFDWTNPGTDKIVSNVVNNIEPGSIILMHDVSNKDKVPNRDQTIEALPQIIQILTNQGYSFLTVSELLSHQSTPTRQELIPS